MMSAQVCCSPQRLEFNVSYVMINVAFYSKWIGRSKGCYEVKSQTKWFAKNKAVMLSRLVRTRTDIKLWPRYSQAMIDK